MNPRFILGTSLFALIVFLLIQFYNIINVYELRSNDFDTRYNEVIREAMDELYNSSQNQGMDSMYWYLDKASFYWKDINYIEDDEVLDSLKMMLKDIIVEVIESTEPFSEIISYKLNQQEMDRNLKAGFIIHDYSIFDEAYSFPIVQQDTLMLTAQKPLAVNLDLQGSLLDNFRVERDYFAINFDVYVDFTRKRQVIFKEMIGVLAFITFSILIISLVFYFTIRNLMRQKKISDLKTDFINNMTHELKTPLSTISLATHGLSNEELLSDKEKIKELSVIIKRQNIHLTQIIDKILDISMWEKQKIKLDLESIDFVQFLKEKIESFRLVHKDVEIKTFIPHAEFYIDADAFQLSIALNNLLDNAYKYKREKLKLIIDLIINPDELILKVIDNGIGISQQDQKQIFNKFYRVDKATIHNTKGLGLGLFYVQNIIEAHHGEISIESELKKGTTFFIRLKA